jgi:hypothetical protein
MTSARRNGMSRRHVVPARSSSFSALVSVACVAAFAALTIACGGSIENPRGDTVDPNNPGSSSGGNGGNGGSRGVQCAAAPACDPGDTQIVGKRTCQGSRCYERSICGTTIRCEGETAQCAAYPSCKGGWIEVPASQCKTTKCVSETLCGATIYCAPDARCDGYPQCNAGDTQVASSAQCPQDASCYSRSLCDVTIWCTGFGPADAGPPPPVPPQP